MKNFQDPGRSTVYAQNGMVASSHPISSTVGIDILKKGGNAMDAAIAMALVLPLCEPQSTGLFGDVFCMLKDLKSNKYIGLNGSGKAPFNMSSEYLRSEGFNFIPDYDVSSITIPGAIASFESLNKKFGKMSISELCEPAIYYANQGVVITPRVSFDWLNSYKNLKGIAKKYYLNKGKPFKTGEIFYAPKQAEVLKIFSKNGAKGFYEGEVVDDLISSLNKLGGKHTYEDFSNFTVEYVEPVMEKFEDYELYELPPNCQGIVAILLKKLMDHFSLSSLDPLGSNRVHIEAECAKIAYNFRNKILGDPNYYHLNYENFFATTNIEYHVNKINLNNANNDINTHWHGNHKDTVYLTVVDKNRMMVSLIFSIFNSFGSGYASEKYGLIFHNRGAGFSLMKGHPNELVGGKRPLHTIIPAFLSKSNDFYMPFGVMGGQYQANGHARLISNVIDYGMDIQQAIDFPRSFPENGYLKLEQGYSEKVATDLENKGHKIERTFNPIGGAQAIIYDEKKDILYGGSDPRKDGIALGY